ncbi:hypothetical protein B0T18DRAFT_164412 [Schizothecium vesticola]|uniref:C2H2-type domain-containing protein n=1 Tax=Schizothecium vesticola TaxID=314040 RepID=A0AA40EX81_9PEZI|nr:hypothetical protein B0T18DRAFT_164412 [Schizothecium vesticola]
MPCHGGCSGGGFYFLDNTASTRPSSPSARSFPGPPPQVPRQTHPILAATMCHSCQSTAEFPAPLAVLANDSGAHLPSHFDAGNFRRHTNFIAPPSCKHGIPRSSHFPPTAIAPSRCCTPSPASISNSLSGSNYSYSHDSTYSPFGSQSSFGTAPSVVGACNGQPSPDPSHRDSRPQSPANKPFRSQHSRAGFRAPTPFHRHPTPSSRFQSPVHRIQSPALGHRSPTPAIGARGHAAFVNAARLPPGRARDINSTTNIDHSLQRPVRRQSRPGEQSESQDFVMGDADGSPQIHLAFGEQQVQGHPDFDQGGHCSQNSVGSRHDHSAMPHAEESQRHPFQDRRNSPDRHESEPSPPADSPDSNTTSSSDHGTSSPESTKTDEPCIGHGQTIRVLRGILQDEYDLRLGISEPPEDMVDAVSKCLRRLSLSLDRERSLGCVVQLKSFLGDSLAGEAADTVVFTSTDVRSGGSPDNRRKRGALNNDDYNEDIHDDDPDDGGASVDPSTSGTNKKAKMVQLACPFRKLNPLRYNCREWEYCSKAPFRSMSELKKHIIKYHCQSELTFKCPRCHKAFSRQVDVDAHLRQEDGQICQMIDRVASPNFTSEGMVSYSIAERLRSRIELSWSGLWQLLFPEERHKGIPEPDFEPVVELHEVRHEYEAGQPELLACLSSGLEDALGTHLGDDQERAALQILGIVDGFMGEVLRKTQRQAAAGPSYPRPRRSGGGPSDGTLEASRHSRGFLRLLSAANIPRTPSTLSTSTTSGHRNPGPLPPPTPARSNGSASPAVSVPQSYNPSMSRVTSPTSNRSSSRRSMVSDPNAAQARVFHQQRSLPEHTVGIGSSVASFNDRTPERVVNRQSLAFESAPFPIPERAITHRHDTVSPAQPLRNFSQSSDLDTRQVPTNVTGFHGYNNDQSLDFTLPDMATASQSSVPWSGLGLGFGTSGSQLSPAPVGMTEAEIYEYVRGMAESSSAELERGPGDSSLNEVVMGGRQERWTSPVEQERGHEQPRHDAERESSRLHYCTASEGRARHHSTCAFVALPTLTSFCLVRLS